MTVTSGLRVWAATCLLLLSSQHFPIGLATADPSDNLLRQRDLQSCFNHIEDINTLEDSIEDTMVSRTYVLCPFTTYGLGSIDDDGSVVGGEEPLRLRSNAKVQCGESGESINGCLVYGGDYGILMLTPLLEDLSNVEIQGLTFSLQQKAAIVLGRPGDVTVTDCVIKDQDNDGAVQALYTIGGGRRLVDIVENTIGTSGLYYLERLVENERQRKRALKTLRMPMGLQLTFDKVVFEDNSMVATNETTAYPGLVTGISEDVTMIFKDTIFRNNDFSFGNEGNITSTYAISTPGPLTITDSCFQNNQFLTMAPVVAYSSDVVTENVFGTTDMELECEYLATISGNGTTSECTLYDATSCQAQVVTSPTMGPSSYPTLTTSSSPSSSPVESPSSIPSSMPSMGPTERCRVFGAECTSAGQCCSNRCLLDRCQRPAKDSDAREPLGGGRGGGSGLNNNDRGGAAGGQPIFSIFQGGGRRKMMRGKE